MEKQMVTLKPEEFKLLKSALGKDLKSKCDFCGRKITSKNYGYLTYDTVSFKKFSEDKIKQDEKDINIIRNEIEQLKPYQKDMICETFLKQKYG
jgi:hypothetical protein